VTAELSGEMLMPQRRRIHASDETELEPKRRNSFFKKKRGNKKEKNIITS
jgi:hypothetical protein